MAPRSPSRPVLLASGVAACASVYFIQHKLSNLSPTCQRGTFSPNYFISSTVLSNEPSSVDTRLLRLSIPQTVLPPSHQTIGSIWSVYIKDDDIQVERPYTPLEGIDEHGNLLFWIKKYPQGEVGRWLHTKKSGDSIQIRGPLETWHWKDDDTLDQVVMISGGTGITPFYQLFHSVISRQVPENKTSFTLLHSSRTPIDLPPPRIIGPLISYATSHPDKLNVQLFVDSTNGLSSSAGFPSFRVGRINRSVIERSLGPQKNALPWWKKPFVKQKHLESRPKRILFLVCGPEPMIDSISGPYGRNFSQGVVGGVLGEMGFTSKQTWHQVENTCIPPR